VVPALHSAGGLIVGGFRYSGWAAESAADSDVPGCESACVPSAARNSLNRFCRARVTVGSLPPLPAHLRSVDPSRLTPARGLPPGRALLHRRHLLLPGRGLLVEA
jgi:hypothetical protein